MSDNEEFSLNSGESTDSQQELDFFSKIIGVFTSPAATIETISKFLPKASDWVVPIIIMMILAIASNFIYMGNSALKQQIMDKQFDAIEKNYAEQVEKGKITRQQADEQFEAMKINMEKQMGVNEIFKVIGIVIFTFGFFLLISLIYFIIVRFILKGEGNYKVSLVSYGLPYYILILQYAVIVIFTLFSQKVVMDASLATVLNADRNSLAGFIMTKCDPFLIWFYIILGISYSKMFKSGNVKKYVITFIGIWIGFNILMFVASKHIATLKWFVM